MSIAFTGQSQHYDSGPGMTDPSTASGQMILGVYGDGDNGGAAFNPVDLPTGFSQIDNQKNNSNGTNLGNSAITDNPNSGGVGAGLNFGNFGFNTQAVVSYSGCAAVSPLNVEARGQGNFSSTTTASITGPSVTTTTANCTLIILVVMASNPGSSFDGTGAFTPPAGFTQRVDNHAQVGFGSWPVCVAAFEQNTPQAAPGASGTIPFSWTQTNNTTGNWVCYTVALAPAGGGGGGGISVGPVHYITA